MKNIEKSIEDFLEMKLPAKEFERCFIEQFQKISKKEYESMSDEENLSLSKIFSAVDRFYDGDDLDGSDIGESELRYEVNKWSAFLSGLRKG